MFTSESVTEGHPDKLCDQISDAIVDHFLERDPNARVRVECAVSSAIVFIAGSFASSAKVDFSHVARRVITQIGYDQPDFNAKTCSILNIPQELPPNRHHTLHKEGANEGKKQIPVRNQATVFGFASDQTPEYMPMPIWLARQLTRRLSIARLGQTLPYLTPDGSAQVGVEYRNRKPYRIHSITIVASQREDDGPDLRSLHRDIHGAVIEPAFEDEEIRPDRKTKIFINPDGIFLGGPSYHSGLTGRKNSVDTYGEYSRHSGNALSGKEPVRTHRAGSYAARYAAKNVVAAGLASECEITVSYAIGLTKPVSVQAETFGTGKMPDDKITDLVRRTFDFRLAEIGRNFNLKHLPSMNPGGFYQSLAAFGHFGRTDMDLPWEKADKVAELS